MFVIKYHLTLNEKITINCAVKTVKRLKHLPIRWDQVLSYWSSFVRCGVSA